MKSQFSPPATPVIPTIPTLGIDFGTSNSKMAWYNPKLNAPDIIKNGDDDQTPSVVYFGKDEHFVGKDAVEMLEDENECLRVCENIKLDMVRGNFFTEEKIYEPWEVVTEILSKLKHIAEDRAVMEKVTNVVITCPATFDQGEKDALNKAATEAGFTSVVLLEEPEAAAYAYTQMASEAGIVGKYVLVYDLGGGTFDLALLERREADGVFTQVMKPQGMRTCGGDDFDRALYDKFDACVQKDRGSHIGKDGLMDMRFFHRCRKLKCDLTSKTKARISIQLPSDRDYKWEMTRSEFEELIRAKVEKTLEKTADFLKAARAEGYAVETIVLVGGSARIPLVEEMLRKKFPELHISKWDKGHLAVALGAAYYAHKLWNADKAKSIGTTSTDDTDQSGKEVPTVPADPTAEKQYRQAVEAAWANKTLDQAQVERFTALANKLGLSREQVISVEQAVMGQLKEAILALQDAKARYQKAVEAAWAGERLEDAEIKTLILLGNALGLSREQRANIERMVMGETKEEIVARQDALAKQQKAEVARKRAALPVGTIVHGRYKITEVVYEGRYEHLYRVTDSQSEQECWNCDAQQKSKGHEVCSDCGANLLDAPYTMYEYMLAGDNTRITQVPQGVLVNTFGEHERTYIIVLLMDEKRKTLVYRKAVETAWADKQLDASKVGRLATLAEKYKLRSGAVAAIEREVMGATREDILKRSPVVPPTPDRSPHMPAESPQPADKPPSPAPQPALYTLLHTCARHQGVVQAVALSRDGQTLISGSADKTIQIWNASTGELLRTLVGHTAEINALVLSRDGELLASGSTDTTIMLWHPPTGQPRAILTGHSQKVLAVAISGDRQLLVSGSAGGSIKVWNANSGLLLQSMRGHTGAVHAVAISPDGQLLVSGSADQTIKVWSTGTGAVVRMLTGHTQEVYALAMARNGELLASGGADKTIRLWHLPTGQLLCTFSCTGSIDALAFKSGGQLLVSGHTNSSFNDTLIVWDIQASKQACSLSAGDAGMVKAVAISADGEMIAASSDATTKVLRRARATAGVAQGRNSLHPYTRASQAKDFTVQCTLTEHTAQVRSVVFSADGQVLVSGSRDRTVKVWNPQTAKLLYTLAGHADMIWSVGISKDGRLIASGSVDKTIKLWDGSTGMPLRTLIGHEQEVYCVAIRPDGQLLASGSRDQTIRVWDIATGALLRTIPTSAPVTCLVFRADGQILVSGGDAQIGIWDVATGTLLRTLSGHTKMVQAVAISPDGYTLVSGSSDKTMKVWDMRSSDALYTFVGHSHAVLSVAISPDGQTLASSSNEVKLWNMHTGELLRTSTDHSKAVCSLAFSADGQWLASGSSDTTIKLWKSS